MNPIHAFPMAGDTTNGGWCYDGMTLRDYFAAKAMQAWMLSPPNTNCDGAIAEWAYATADAMLREREKVKP